MAARPRGLVLPHEHGSVDVRGLRVVCMCVCVGPYERLQETHAIAPQANTQVHSALSTDRDYVIPQSLVHLHPPLGSAAVEAVCTFSPGQSLVLPGQPRAVPKSSVACSSLLNIYDSQVKRNAQPTAAEILLKFSHSIVGCGFAFAHTTPVVVMLNTSETHERGKSL